MQKRARGYHTQTDHAGTDKSFMETEEGKQFAEKANCNFLSCNFPPFLLAIMLLLTANVHT